MMAAYYDDQPTEVVHAHVEAADGASAEWNGVTGGPSELATGLPGGAAVVGLQPCPWALAVTPSDTMMAGSVRHGARDAWNVPEGED